MDFAAAALEQYAPLVEQANGLAAKLDAQSNTAALVFEVRENSDDPKLVAVREYINDLNEKVLAAQKEAEDYIRSAGLVNVEDLDVPAVTTQYSAAADSASKLRSAVESIVGADATKEWPKLVIPAGSKKRSGATGVPKPRWQKITVGGVEVYSETTADGKTTRAVTLTALAQWMNEKLKAAKSTERVDSGNLRDAVFTAAGTTDVSSRNGEPFSMAYSVGELTFPEIVLTPAVK